MRGMFIAGSGKMRERERRVKYLNRRGNETLGTNNKQANKQKPASAVSTAPARARRARRHDFRIPRPVRLRRYVGRGGEKQKECVDVNYTLRFLTRDRMVGFTCNANKHSNKRCYIIDVRVIFEFNNVFLRITHSSKRLYIKVSKMLRRVSLLRFYMLYESLYDFMLFYDYIQVKFCIYNLTQ